MGAGLRDALRGAPPPPSTQKQPYSPPRWVIYGSERGNRTPVLLYGRMRVQALSAGFTNGNGEEHTFV